MTSMSYEMLVARLTLAHSATQQRALAAVNQALTCRNWLIGAWIFEYEQGGSDRATYGERLLERLAEDLCGRGVSGSTDRFLRQCRQIALAYPEPAGAPTPAMVRLLDEIRLTASAGSASEIRQTLSSE